MGFSEIEIFFRKTVVKKVFAHTVPFAQNYAEISPFHKITTPGN